MPRSRRTRSVHPLPDDPRLGVVAVAVIFLFALAPSGVVLVALVTAALLAGGSLLWLGGLALDRPRRPARRRWPSVAAGARRPHTVRR